MNSRIIMKYIYFLLCFFSSLTVLLAYPVDYNETSIATAQEALKKLRDLISLDSFTDLLQEYNHEISSINARFYAEINTLNNTIAKHILEIQDSASKLDVDITECLENMNHLTPEEFFEKYSEECVNPARALGVTLRTEGNNKRTVMFAKKYEELMHTLNGCLNGGDPAPYICAGIIQLTLEEVERILPTVKVNPPQIQRKMERQILVLAECASEYISVVGNRLKVELNDARSCVLDKINTE